MKQRNFLKYFIILLLFTASFLIAYLYKKTDLATEFLAATQKVPSIRDFNSAGINDTLKIVDTYGLLFGPAIGLLAFLVSLILLLILKIVRLAKFALANMLVLFLVYGGLLALAIELIYYEARFSLLSLAIIYFGGFPLFYASIFTLICILIIYIYSIFKKQPKVTTSEVVEKVAAEKPPSEVIEKAVVEKTAEKIDTIKNLTILLLILSVPFLSGCSIISWLEGDVCDVTADPHCYQGAAVDDGNADKCAKVGVPDQFKGLGSDPPKDKCYLMVAENTGDLTACDKIMGGLMSYTREECILDASLANENPSGCQLLTGEDHVQCVEQIGPKITVEKVLEVDSQIDILTNELQKGSDPNLEKQLKGLQDKKKDMLAVMTADNKKEYNIEIDPLNKQIIGDWATGDIDSATKSKMININEKLKDAGSPLTKDQYEIMRDYYKFINDPANNIENMDDKALAKDNVGDKIKNVVDKLKFWKTADTAEEKSLDEQIRFYDRMSDRQYGISKGLDAKETAYENLVDKIKEKAVEKGAEKGEEKIIEEVFGEAVGKASMITTKILGEAVDEVKEEAKSAEFRGLVNAYDKGMEEELAKMNGNVELAHATVIKNLTADPYAYAEKDSFAKYGNLIENKDCDGSNPHCINKEVFWKAMKKSYIYQHKI